MVVVLVVDSFAGAGVSGAEDSFGRGVTAVGDLEAIAGGSGRARSGIIGSEYWVKSERCCFRWYC